MLHRNELSEFIHYRTYARWLEDEKRRETYEEAIERYLEFMDGKSKARIPPRTRKLIEDHFLKMATMPSMRALWAAGPSLSRNSIGGYNCSYAPIVDITSFAELMYILMNGTGVGYSVEKQYVNQLPTVQEYDQSDREVSLVIVEDSKEGWADALKEVMELSYMNCKFDVDYNKIRPEGARLKVSGGRASGPEPLKNLFDFVTSTIKSAEGRKLTSLEVHDICCRIAEIVQVGGTRRASCICFFDLKDKEMMECKKVPENFNLAEGERKNSWRRFANNSVALVKEPSCVEFMNLWQTLAASGNGEPGLLHVYNIKKYIGSQRRKFTNEFRTNPCFAPSTLIPTKKKGLQRIQNLVGKKVSVFDGQNWILIDNFKITNKNQEILKITLQDGSQIKVTPYHKMILEDNKQLEARNLEVGYKLRIQNYKSCGTLNDGSSYLKGFLLGDGTKMKDRPLLYLYSTKYMCEKRLLKAVEAVKIEDINTNAIEEPNFKEAGENRKVLQGLSPRKRELYPWCVEYKKELPEECFSWNLKTKTDFISGLFDADGTAFDTKNGFSYQLSSVYKDCLLDIQNLLKSMNIYSKLCLTKKSGLKDFNDGYGFYKTKTCWRLTLSQSNSIKLGSFCSFERLVNFKNHLVRYTMKPRFNQIVSIEKDNKSENVYCCTVPKSHKLLISNGILVGQCGEIILSPRSFCNLTSVVIRPSDKFKDVIKKVKVAVWLGVFQSTLTKFKYIRKEWKKNCEEERLLGVSLNGQLDNPKMMTPEKLQILKEYAIEECEKACKIFDINMSAAVTCGKPEGSGSLLVDCTSGMKPREGEYLIRRVRISAMDPLCQLLLSQKAPMVPETGEDSENPKIWVVEFPVKCSKNAIFKDQMSALDQLEWYRKIQTNWCEHNISCTIRVKDTEWFDVGAKVYEMRNEVVAVAFLPDDGGNYPLLPEEAITEEEYKVRKAAFPKINYADLSRFEEENTIDELGPVACSGDKCSIND